MTFLFVIILLSLVVYGQELATTFTIQPNKSFCLIEDLTKDEGQFGARFQVKDATLAVEVLKMSLIKDEIA
jgi:hypothetical protein